MSNHKPDQERREISALILSFLIHAALVVTIVVAGIRIALPPGTVSTEVEFTPTQKPETAAPLTKAPVLAKEEPLKPEKVAENQVPQIVPPKVVQELPEKKDKVDHPLKNPKIAKAITPPKILDQKSDVVDRVSPEPKDELKPVKDSFADDIKQSDEVEKPDTVEPVPPAEVKKVVEEKPVEPDVAKDVEPAPPTDPPAVVADPNSPPSSAAEQATEGDPNSTVKEAWQLKAMPGNVPPEYPMMSRLRRQEGVANFRYTVTKEGRVTNIHVEKSSGYSALDEAAAKALAKYRYVQGQESEVRIPFAFKLTGEAKQMPGALRRAK